MANAERRGLESKAVFDYNRVPLGTVAGASRDPKTAGPTELIINLHPQARERLNEERVSVPFELVFGIRRDEVTLSRSLPELMDLYTAQSKVLDPPQVEPVIKG